MVAAVVIGLLLILALLPGLWVRRVLAHHGRADSYGISGAQAARRFLDRVGLTAVKVEQAGTEGDHYDPQAQAVRLAPERFQSRSLAALVVAAHETGHAMQHAAREVGFGFRIELAKIALAAQRAGIVLFIAAPLLALVARSPLVLLVAAGVGTLGFMLAVLVHVVTLPVELDASFGKALPLLEAGHDLKPADYPAARSILRAAAFTYVASAAMALLSFGRWGGILRR
jgi:Zn-dependent membrane protease YugP